MKIRFPSRLVSGDLIAITAPSSGVPAHRHARLDLAIDALKSKGFRVVEGQCLRSQHKNKSADKALRASELMQFLCDPEVKAVMPPWGGDLAIELLELIDFEKLKAVEPKWFSGFSDLTTLHFPLTILSGWATAHGPNLMELGARVLDETTGRIWTVLESERGSTVTQYSSAQYQVEENQWGAETDTGFNLTQKTVWKRLDGKSERLTFTGRLIGGCLDIIGRIAGTQFGSIEPFKQQSTGDGVILYFENVEMGPCELTRALYSLRLQGWFSGINGIMIGRSAGPNADSDNQQNYLDALQSALGDINIPVLYDVDIGHIPPQMTLVNGAMATVTFSDSGGSVVQELWW